MAMLDENVRGLPGAGRALAACFALAALDALLVLGQSLALALALSHLWAGEALAAQALLIALFFGCFAARQLVSYGRGGLMDRYARKTASWLRERLAVSLYDRGFAGSDTLGSGAMTTTLVEGVAQVRNYLGLIVPKVADMMVVPALLAVALLVLDPISGVIAVVMIPCIVFYMRLMGSYSKENAVKQHGAYMRLANSFVDTIHGMPDLKAFGRSREHAKEVYSSSERLRKATVSTLKSATLSSLVLDLFRVFALAAVAIMLGFRLMSGTVELMPALAVLIILPEFFGAIRRYSADFHASLDGRNQLSSILELIDAPVMERTDEYPVSEDVPALRLHQVGFDYEGPHDASCDRRTLRDIDLTVKGPCKVGIVGTSGAGKSTLAGILAGILSPVEGGVAVNGTEGSTLAVPSWQTQVAFIPQSPHIFHGTLAENIAFYSPNAPYADIQRAAREAGLGELVDSLPQGLDTPIGEGNRMLSGGQEQRIALARAFLDENRRVLVFDEPTAHLDIETELELKSQMLSLMEGHLVFLASHRLHWMADMDLILVLKDGRLVESGTLDELMELDGEFVELVSQMTGGAQ